MDLQWHLHYVFGTVFNVHYKEIYGLSTNGLSDNIACHVERVEKLLLQVFRRTSICYNTLLCNQN